MRNRADLSNASCQAQAISFGQINVDDGGVERVSLKTFLCSFCTIDPIDGAASVAIPCSIPLATIKSSLTEKALLLPLISGSDTRFISSESWREGASELQSH